MAVFLVTAKKDMNSGKIQKGMNVEVVTSSTSSCFSLSNSSHFSLFKEAFKKKYGFEMSSIYSSYFDIKKL